MNEIEKKLISIVIFLTILYFLFREPTITLTPGVKVADPPMQEELIENPSFPYLDATLTSLASIELKAKVLSKKYYSDGNAYLVPLDLALGWGVMSDEAILNEFEISQSVRFATWRLNDNNNYTFTPQQVATSIANMHIIPANESIKKSLSTIHKGDIIALKGNLISMQLKNGATWKSSLVRTDTGNGACELVWVKDIKIITDDYF